MDAKVLTLFDDDDFQPPPSTPRAGRNEKGKEIDEQETASAISLDIPGPEMALEVADAGDENIKNEAARSNQEMAVDKEGDDILDAQMKAALIQADYTQYVYKEMPVQPKQQVMGSGIVFEGVVAPKKNEPEIVINQTPQADKAAVVEKETPEEALPEWHLESRYYSIGEVAKLFGVNTSHIRFWTTQFKLKPRTTRKGDRLYNTDDINQLRLIHHLVKENKHTIKGAKEKLKDKDRVEVNLDLKTSLSRLKDILAEMKDKL